MLSERAAAYGRVGLVTTVVTSSGYYRNLRDTEHRGFKCVVHAHEIALPRVDKPDHPRLHPAIVQGALVVSEPNAAMRQRQNKKEIVFRLVLADLGSRSYRIAAMEEPHGCGK